MNKQSFDAIIVLSSRQIDKEGRFANFERDKSGNEVYIGGEARMRAASASYIQNPDARFIMLGGVEIDQQGTLLEKTLEMEKYLKILHPKIKISRINSLPCTRHNLIAFANAPQEDLKLETVALLSNDYHRQRIEAWQSD